MKLEKAISKPSVVCEGCKYKDQCPYLDRSECFEFNSAQISKSELEGIGNGEEE